jgi:DNA processing protein
MTACDDCLRRSELIASVASRLDVEWRRRSAPAGVLSLPDERLAALDPSGRAGRRYERFSGESARAAVEGAGLSAICRCDPAYPDRLRELDDPPAVLHVAGCAAALVPETAVAIVGARRGTGYGLEVARALGRGIAAAGLPVVSGMAMGVDSAAHVGALERAPAGVVAVLAGGADVPYPPSRRRLYERIVEQGCVVSELPPRFAAFRWNFVARNRIIAGLAALTVVVEAAERSGSLTTADFAAQLGRPVAAVPGPVTSRFSAGTNGLLAAGAAVARDTRDVLDHLLGPDAARDAALAAAAGASTVPGAAGARGSGVAPSCGAAPDAAAVPIEPRLRTLLDAIERGHGSLAELATDPASGRQVLQDLTDLELRGLVRREFGGRYVRAHQERT